MKKGILRTLALTLIFVLAFSTVALAGSRPEAPITDAHVEMIYLATLPRTYGDGYTQFYIPAEAFNVGIEPHWNNIMSGNAGNMSAHFGRGQRVATSPEVRLNGQDPSIPYPARVTNVTASFQIVTDFWSGVSTHTMSIRHWCWRGIQSNGETFSSNPLATNQVQNVAAFNGNDPYGIWGINLVARRDILNPATDNGLTATVRNVVLRIYWV